MPTETRAGVSASDLLARLREGVRRIETSEDWRRLLAAQAKFHDYSIGNVMLIFTQRPDATRVAGFRTWLALERHVMRGEKGIAILAPVHPRLSPEERAERRALRDKDAGVGELDRQPVGFRVVHVFDVAQTDGRPLPEPPGRILEGGSGEAEWLLPRLRALVDAQGLEIDTRAAIPGGALGALQPGERRILLREDLAPDQEAKTLAHELAHHLLGHGGAGVRDRVVEEAAAEGVAFVVCARFGLDTSEYSFGYIAGWTARVGGAEVLAQVGGAIQRTARRMIDWSDPPAREIEEVQEHVQALRQTR